jgi:hypothetical protein
MMRTFQPSVFKWDICKLIDKEHGTRQTRINGAQYDGRPQNLLVQRALVCEQGKKNGKQRALACAHEKPSSP